MHGDEVIVLLRRLRYAAAADAVLRSCEKLAQAYKANFDPNQPRVPAGSPDGGQWASTGGGGSGRNDPRVLSDAMPDDDWKPGAQYAANTTRAGHHFVPRQVFKDLPLSSEVRRVLDNARTGRLSSGPHGWSAEHRVYNQAVDEQLRSFLNARGIEPEQMTPEQAREFVKQIKESQDPRIRNFNRRIYQREILYWIRRAPRRID